MPFCFGVLTVPGAVVKLVDKEELMREKQRLVALCVFIADQQRP